MPRQRPSDRPRPSSARRGGGRDRRPAGPSGPERVAKIMARRGMCSRREAERLIGAGQVLVDGQVMREQGCKAALNARIELADMGQGWLDNQVTVILNKPVGVVSTQPEGGQVPAWKLLTREHLHGSGDPAAIERVLAHPYYLNVAGRLDKDSRGLLVLTQDGVLARRLTCGSIAKVYQVAVDRDPTPEQIDAMRGQRELDGKALRPMQIRRRGPRQLRFELREGRKHQIRRVCEQAGLRVTDLERVAIGPWRLDDLPLGRFRLLTSDELARLRD